MLNSAERAILINLKILTIAHSFLLNVGEHEHFSANEYENVNYCCHFSYFLAEKISWSAELSMKKFYNLGASDRYFCLIL